MDHLINMMAYDYPSKRIRDGQADGHVLSLIGKGKDVAGGECDVYTFVWGSEPNKQYTIMDGSPVLIGCEVLEDDKTPYIATSAKVYTRPEDMGDQWITEASK